MLEGFALGGGFKHMLNLKHVPSILLIEDFSEKVLMLLFLLGTCPCAHVSRHISTVWKSKAFLNAFPDSKLRTNLFGMNVLALVNVNLSWFLFPSAFHFEQYPCQAAHGLSSPVLGQREAVNG